MTYPSSDKKRVTKRGFSTKEQAETMAQLSSQFASISPGVTTDTAQEGLVSAIKGFGIAVEDVEREIMDNVNKIGNTMATSNGDIIAMLERSSAAMKAANNDIRETIALESAAVEITQNAEQTGTAFRTISMRIRGYDEETEELSDDLVNIKGDIADLTKTAKSASGISIFKENDPTTYKSTYEILKDISNIWDELTDKQQAALLEKLGGKRGGQVLAGLLNDFSQVEFAMEQMENAAGSADAEMGIIEDSVDFKLNKIKQTWVGVLMELIDRGDIGELLDSISDASDALGETVISITPAIKTLFSILENGAKIIEGLAKVMGPLLPMLVAGFAVERSFGGLLTYKDDAGKNQIRDFWKQTWLPQNNNVDIQTKLTPPTNNDITNVIKQTQEEINNIPSPRAQVIADNNWGNGRTPLPSTHTLSRQNQQMIYDELFGNFPEAKQNWVEKNVDDIQKRFNSYIKSKKSTNTQKYSDPFNLMTGENKFVDRTALLEDTQVQKSIERHYKKYGYPSKQKSIFDLTDEEKNGFANRFKKMDELEKSESLMVSRYQDNEKLISSSASKSSNDILNSRESVINSINMLSQNESDYTYKVAERLSKLSQTDAQSILGGMNITSSLKSGIENKLNDLYRIQKDLENRSKASQENQRQNISSAAIEADIQKRAQAYRDEQNAIILRQQAIERENKQNAREIQNRIREEQRATTERLNNKQNETNTIKNLEEEQTNIVTTSRKTLTDSLNSVNTQQKGWADNVVKQIQDSNLEQEKVLEAITKSNLESGYKRALTNRVNDSYLINNLDIQARSGEMPIQDRQVSELQSLQAEYDKLSASINKAKNSKDVLSEADMEEVQRLVEIRTQIDALTVSRNQESSAVIEQNESIIMSEEKLLALEEERNALATKFTNGEFTDADNKRYQELNTIIEEQNQLRVKNNDLVTEEILKNEELSSARKKANDTIIESIASMDGLLNAESAVNNMTSLLNIATQEQIQEFLQTGNIEGFTAEQTELLRQSIENLTEAEKRDIQTIIKRNQALNQSGQASANNSQPFLKNVGKISGIAMGAGTALNMLSTSISKNDEELGESVGKMANFVTSVSMITMAISQMANGLMALTGAESILAALVSPVGALVVGIPLLAGGIYLLATAEERHIKKLEKSVESTKELFNENKKLIQKYKETEVEVNSLAEKYEKLSKGVDSSTNENIALSTEEYSEYLEVCNKLVDIYPELYKGMDNNGNAILDFGSDCDSATSKLKELLAAEQEAAALQIKSNLGSAKEGINSQKELVDSNKNKLNTIESKIKSLENLSNQISNNLFNSTNEVKTIEEAVDLTNLLVEMNNAFKESYRNSEEYDGFSEIPDLDPYFKEIIDYSTGEITGYDIIVDQSVWEKYFSQNSDFINNISENLNEQQTDAQREFDQATKSYEIMYNDFISDVALAMTTSSSYQEMDSTKQQLAQKIVSDLPEELKQQLLDSEDPIEWYQNEIISKLDSAKMSYDLRNLIDLTLDDSNGGTLSDWQKILEQLVKSGLTPDDPIYIYFQSKIMDDVKSKNAFVNSVVGEAGENGVTLDDRKEALDFYDELSEADKDYANSQAFKDAVKKKEKELDGLKLTTEQYNDLLLEVKKNEAIKTEQPFSTQNLSETTDNLNSIYELFKKVHEAGKDFKGLDISDFEGLDEKFKVGDLAEPFKELERVASDSSSTIADIDKAFNNYATALINAQLATGELTEKDKSLISSQLQLAGATKESADAWIENAFNIQNAEEKMRNELSATNTTALEAANTKLKDAEMAEIDRIALLNLALEEIKLNNTKLSFSEQIEALQQLGAQAGITAAEMAAVMGATSAMGTDWRYYGSTQAEAQEYLINKSIDAITEKINNVNLDLDPSGIKDAGGAAKDAAKDVDKLADAYNNLYEIVQNYNENGEISIDQAEQLASMDLKWIALLSEQGDKLTINQAAVDGLTASKRELLKVELYQNALDTINAIQSEADAMKILAAATDEATGSTLGLLKAKVAMALSDKVKAGYMNQSGADTILAGLAAAEKAIDASVMKTKDKDSDKDKDKDKDYDKDREEEKYEEEFNWIERKLDKLAKYTASISNTIDNLYSWNKKNKYIDKEISSINSEISGNRQAYYFYMQEAEKQKLDSLYKAKVQNGDFIVETLYDEALGKQIQKYQEWYDQAQKCLDIITDLYNTQRDLIRQKLSNVIDAYGEFDSYLSSIVSKFDSILNLNEAMGKRSSLVELADQFEAVWTQIEAYQDVNSNAIKEISQITYGLSEEDAEQVVKLRTGTDEETIRTQLEEQKNNIVSDIKNTGAYKKIEEALAKAQANLDKAIKKNNKNSIEKYRNQINTYNQQLSAITENATADTVSTYLDTYKKFQKLEQKQDSGKTLSASQKKQYDSLKATLEQYSQNRLDFENELQSTIDAINDGVYEKSAKDIIKEEQSNYVQKIKDTASYNKIKEALDTANSNLLKAKQKGNQKNIAKYQKLVDLYTDELADIEKNATVENVNAYAKNYEAYMKLMDKLESKGQLSKSENTQLEQLKSYREAYIAERKDLEESWDENLAIEMATSREDKIQATYKKSLEDMNESYESQLNAISSDLHGTKQYKDLKAQIDTLNQKKNTKKGLSKSEESKLAALQEKLNALEAGATSENISDYIKVYDELIKLGNKSKLNAKQAARYDELTNIINSYKSSKQSKINSIMDEWNDAIQNLGQETKQKSDEALTEYNNQLAKAYELAKQFAEYRISTLNDELTLLDSQISANKSLIDLYQSLGDEQLRYFGYLNDNQNKSDIINEKYSNSIESATKKYNNLLKTYEQYSGLLDSLDTNDLASSLNIYNELLNDPELSSETKKKIQKVIDFLNDRAAQGDDWEEYADLWENEWKNAFESLESDVASSVKEIQSLKDEFRNWELSGINNAIEKIESFKNALSSIIGLINDDWLYDENGITEYGLSKVKLLTQELGNAQDEVNKYAEAYNLINNAGYDPNNKNSYASYEEWDKARNEALQNYYSSLTSVYDIENQIYQIAQKAQEEEINNLKELAQKLKDALAAKKSLYDYDKNLKNQTKAVENIQAQIDALQGISTAESRSQLAQLQSQLEEAQTQLDETQDQHNYDTVVKAIDDMISDLEDALNKSTGTIAETFENFASTLKEMIGEGELADVNSSMNKIYDLLMNVTNNGTELNVGANTNTSSNSEYVKLDNSTISGYSPQIQQVYSAQQSLANSMDKMVIHMDDVIDKLTSINNHAADISKNTADINLNVESLLTIDTMSLAGLEGDLSKYTAKASQEAVKTLSNQLKKLGLNLKY